MGHQLACQITVTYPLPLLVTPVGAASAAITVTAQPPPPGVPLLSALRVSPHTFTLTGRLVKGRCAALTRADRHRRRCTRPLALKVSYALSLAASVTVTIERTAPGRLVQGHCQAATRAERRHRRCTRTTARGTMTVTGKAGAGSFRLGARIGRLKLSAGSYRLLVTPIDAAGTGTHQRATFQIAR